MMDHPLPEKNACRGQKIQNKTGEFLLIEGFPDCPIMRAGFDPLHGNEFSLLSKQRCGSWNTCRGRHTDF